MREAFIYYLTPGTAKLHTRHEKEKAVTFVTASSVLFMRRFKRSEESNLFH